MDYTAQNARIKKLNAKRDLLSNSVEEKIVWQPKEDAKNSCFAILTLPPFKGWKLVIEQSSDKWDQGSFDFWVIPTVQDQHKSKLTGGHGAYPMVEAEIGIFRFNKLKKLFNEFSQIAAALFNRFATY